MQRLNMKSDTSLNWSKATNFRPAAGEVIEYSDLKRFKIGDGATLLQDLPFKLNGEARVDNELLILNLDEVN